MKDFIEFLVKQIIKNPKELVVEEEINDTVVNIRICVAESDMGILIGKQGRTIRSIRDLAKAKAIKDNVKVYVETC